MEAHIGKPLALVDNKTGHLMLLVDARTLGVEVDSGTQCQLCHREGKGYLDLSTEPTPSSIGPFSQAEINKLTNCHRLTIALFADGIVTRAREVVLHVPSSMTVPA